MCNRPFINSRRTLATSKLGEEKHGPSIETYDNRYRLNLARRSSCRPSPNWAFEKMIVNIHESSTLDPRSHGSLGCQRAPCAVSTVEECLTPPGEEFQISGE
ncbi:hypothetical protein KC332_g10 [Hortaea werneckii]|nr:hypothetical protein KC348_g15 [Hortaea werneckii]KAI7421944.1 hypothetical protein KC332_g10 [Hortaea werneckii]